MSHLYDIQLWCLEWLGVFSQTSPTMKHRKKLQTKCFWKPTIRGDKHNKQGTYKHIQRWNGAQEIVVTCQGEKMRQDPSPWVFGEVQGEKCNDLLEWRAVRVLWVVSCHFGVQGSFVPEEKRCAKTNAAIHLYSFIRFSCKVPRQQRVQGTGAGKQLGSPEICWPGSLENCRNKDPRMSKPAASEAPAMHCKNSGKWSLFVTFLSTFRNCIHSIFTLYSLCIHCITVYSLATRVSLPVLSDVVVPL
jgi:hypothetical protein